MVYFIRIHAHIAYPNCIGCYTRLMVESSHLQTPMKRGSSSLSFNNYSTSLYMWCKIYVTCIVGQGNLLCVLSSYDVITTSCRCRWRNTGGCALQYKLPTIWCASWQIQLWYKEQIRYCVVYNRVSRLGYVENVKPCHLLSTSACTSRQ